MLDKKENNDNYNYILNKCKEYLSVHMGRVETSISSKERNAIITLKIPFLIITDELINSLNEAKNRVQNIMNYVSASIFIIIIFCLTIISVCGKIITLD